jgi:hypothetical protein
VTDRWTCAACGEEHVGLPLDFAFDEPVHWDGPRAPGDYLDSDLCVWTDDGGTRCHFVRGVLEIPVLETGDRFAYGVWGSLSAESFERLLADWDDAGRVEAPPYFSWLSNSIPGYPETLNLRANVITRTPDPGRRSCSPTTTTIPSPGSSGTGSRSSACARSPACSCTRS